jgi:hypothetical protein
MIKLAITALAMLPALAADVYRVPFIPDEAIKVEALKLAYLLNGNSMSRGFVDVSGPVRCMVLQPAAEELERRRDLCRNAR